MWPGIHKKGVYWDICGKGIENVYLVYTLEDIYIRVYTEEDIYKHIYLLYI
jgi:hypothetical protein